MTLTLLQVAGLLGCAPKVVYAWARQGLTGRDGKHTTLRTDRRGSLIVTKKVWLLQFVDAVGRDHPAFARVDIYRISGAGLGRIA